MVAKKKKKPLFKDNADALEIKIRLSEKCLHVGMQMIILSPFGIFERKRKVCWASSLFDHEFHTGF